MFSLVFYTLFLCTDCTVTVMFSFVNRSLLSGVIFLYLWVTLFICNFWMWFMFCITCALDCTSLFFYLLFFIVTSLYIVPRILSISFPIFLSNFVISCESFEFSVNLCLHTIQNTKDGHRKQHPSFFLFFMPYK